ncbi:MAG: 2-oxoacid:acceptor oxidoreductase family protein [Planctomycetia bacterium]|nr:2-oxoacid:acceptor oxidoreductase family protein [Planctomycetia bacterium]
MIRIRFHGRGGHGVKTAGRIVGTAAFLASLQVQDSPVYGAERRGAPVAAFTRFDSAPILERGVIDSPDLIVIADETLLADAGAAVLAGQTSAAAVFVNAPAGARLNEKYQILPPLVTWDITARTQAVLGTASALSAGLAAAAAKLTGLISAEHLLAAVREELRQLRATADVVDKNVTIAAEVFDQLSTVRFAPAASGIAGEVLTVGYEGVNLGTASILAPGNAQQRNTGTWRVERPEIDYDVCTRCGLCQLGCPDGAIKIEKNGFPVIDYDHCKGCMICAQVCPLHGIARTKEVRSW